MAALPSSCAFGPEGLPAADRPIAMPHLLLNCEIAERQSPGLHQGRVAFQIDDLSISTRELIAVSVRTHLALRRIASTGAASPAPRDQTTPTLTPALIEEGLAQGRVALPRPPEPARTPDLAAVEQAEIQRAGQPRHGQQCGDDQCYKKQSRPQIAATGLLHLFRAGDVLQPVQRGLHIGPA